MRFVIVEDEIWIREGIRKLLPKLDEENVIVGEAENGVEGVEVVRKENPDVIITDVRMPVMDGLEMLEEIYAEGCKAKSIVLSAYSEFEYARSALRLGVTEYLLKPIVMADFSEAVERVKFELEKERKRHPKQIGSLDQVMKNILAGDFLPEEEVTEYLIKEFGLDGQLSLALFVSYFEEWSDKKCDRFIRKIKMIFSEKPSISYCVIEDEKQKEIIIIIYNYAKNQNIKRWIQGHFLQKSNDLDGVAMGWAESPNIFNLKDNYEEVEQYLEWNILLGSEVIISCPEIQRVQTSLCVYPLDIENQMKTAVCSNDPQKIKKSVEQFQKYFQNGKIYEPKSIKECYVRFFWAMINFSKEIGNFNFEHFEQRELLDRITHTKTREGMKRITIELVERLQRTEEQIENLNVKRAVAMIHEFYRTGITLDESAAKRGITPEYLGTQFHQVLGVNFSAYLKQFRLNKAKELLLGTQLKLYEIAELIGYSDSKYFSKVFKAETGYLPADYRKIYK